MPLRHLLLACSLGLAALAAPLPRPAAAETAATPATLAETLRMPELIEVLREEGLAYAETLDDDLFPGRGGADWLAQAQLVYDAPAMLQRFNDTMAAELADQPQAVAAAQAFFTSPLGARVLTLEIEARRALLDKTVEDAARARVDEMRAEDSPRLAALDAFVTANDLIEANVQGALNANLAFYRGMVEAGGLGEAVDEGQMLADVWAQEEEVREETRIWLMAYVAMAYDPLSDAELQSYIDFSATPAGQRLNAALFAAFDAVFVQVSRDLGRAAGLQMMGQDI
jgi:hypothetical protein